MDPLCTVNNDRVIDYFYKAAVSCSADGAMLGGAGLVSGMTGKPRRAWHRCMGGAWHQCMGRCMGLVHGFWGCWIAGVVPEHWGLLGGCFIQQLPSSITQK